MLFKSLILSSLLVCLAMIFHADVKAEQISKEETARLQSFLKKRLGSRMPSDATIEVKGYENSPIQGFNQGTFSINSSRGSGDVNFIISNDGRYIILGEPASTKEFEQSPIQGLKKGSAPLGTQTLPLLISKDSKYIILGEIIDTSVDPLKDTMSKISLEDVPLKGIETANVTIVEYSDFQCPFCKRGSQMLPQILQEYDGKIKLMYKQLPLPMHNWAKDAAIASLCAHEQGNDKFWEFHDLLFENQQNIKVENSNDEFKGFAKKIGLNENDFDKCLGSADIAKRVQADIDEARSIGVTSTPTFVVNGLVVPGANPEGLKSAIETSLSGEQ
ncbi:MAG: thioredoxin domain-containing protein [Thermodesulfobacteriota bacterium]